LLLYGIDLLQHIGPLAAAVQNIVQLLIVRPTRKEADAPGSFIHDEHHQIRELIAELINFRATAFCD
jgi:hypothetical protein